MICIQDFCVPEPLFWAVVTATVVFAFVLALSMTVSRSGKTETEVDVVQRPQITVGQEFVFFEDDRYGPLLVVTEVNTEDLRLGCKIVIPVPAGCQAISVSQSDDSVQLTYKTAEGNISNQEWHLNYNYPESLSGWDITWFKVESRG